MRYTLQKQMGWHTQRPSDTNTSRARRKRHTQTLTTNGQNGWTKNKTSHHSVDTDNFLIDFPTETLLGIQYNGWWEGLYIGNQVQTETRTFLGTLTYITGHRIRRMSFHPFLDSPFQQYFPATFCFEICTSGIRYEAENAFLNWFTNLAFPIKFAVIPTGMRISRIVDVWT